MKKDKHYEFKAKGLILELILTVVWLLPVIVALVFFYANPVMALIIGTIPAVIFVYQFLSVYTILQFTKYDKGKSLIISANRSLLTISQEGSKKNISQSEIDRVEIYRQVSVGKFEAYNYLVLFTLTGQAIVLTEFIVPSLDDDNIFRSFIKGAPKVCFKRYFNYIDETKFKV
jgi:hypothetical protein